MEYKWNFVKLIFELFFIELLFCRVSVILEWSNKYKFASFTVWKIGQGTYVIWFCLSFMTWWSSLPCNISIVTVFKRETIETQDRMRTCLTPRCIPTSQAKVVANSRQIIWNNWLSSKSFLPPWVGLLLLLLLLLLLFLLLLFFFRITERKYVPSWSKGNGGTGCDLPLISNNWRANTVLSSSFTKDKAALWWRACTLLVSWWMTLTLPCSCPLHRCPSLVKFQNFVIRRCLSVTWVAFSGDIFISSVNHISTGPPMTFSTKHIPSLWSNVNWPSGSNRFERTLRLKSSLPKRPSCAEAANKALMQLCETFKLRTSWASNTTCVLETTTKSSSSSINL